MRRLLTTTILVAALPSLTVAQSGPDRPTLWTALLDFDVLAQRMLQGAVMGLRTQLDIVYGDMSVDLFTGKVTLTELRAWPLPDWDEEGSCKVSIDRITLRTGALDVPDRITAKAQVIGAAFPSSCLPPDLQEPLGLIGKTEIEIPRLTLEFDYGFPSSDLRVRAHGELTGLATIDAEASMTYVWFDGREDMDDPIPVVFHEYARLSIENAGLWEAVLPLIPPPLTNEGSGQFISQSLSQELARENRFALDDEAAGLSPAQQVFVTSVAESWPAFVANPQKIVMETTNDGDVFLDFGLIDDDPREIFEAMQPVVGLRPSSPAAMVPASFLSAIATGATAELSEADRRSLGLALISGTGAPRNLSAGLEILRPLAGSGDGDAAAAIAKAVEHTQPDVAYLAALAGGEAEIEGIPGLLDRLEKRLGLSEVLTQQASLTIAGDAPVAMPASIAGIRSEAAMRFSGIGRLRSYETAATWAMLGAAAGDAESADILADIEERVRLGGSEAIAAWAEAEKRASDEALRIWLENDLATRLSQ